MFIVHSSASQHQKPEKRWPLLVYVQGSAWRKQELDLNLASLSWVARRGCAVAIAEYRPSDVAPFPAQIQDAKTAIRYLRMKADDFKLDPERVVLWGDSSGGHTAVIAGITRDVPELDTGLYGEYSCDVQGIIDYYGPTDIGRMNEAPSTMDHTLPDSPEGRLIGGFHVLRNPDKVAPAVCMNHIAENVPIPPIVIFHGSKDRLVPFEQSVLLYEDLRRKGKEADFYALEHADHGGPAFWSDEVLGIVETYLRKWFGED